MAKMLTATSSSPQLGFLGIEFPEQALKPGDSWTKKLDLSKKEGEAAAENKTLNIVFTLNKVEVGIATVTAVTKGKVETEGMGGMQMTVDLDTSTIYEIEVASGLPKTVKTTGHNKIDTGMGVMDQRVESSLTRN